MNAAPYPKFEISARALFRGLTVFSFRFLSRVWIRSITPRLMLPNHEKQKH